MSQPEYLPQGDVEGAIINWLINDSHIASFPGGAPTVSSTFIGYNDKDPAKRRWVMVTREGGNLIWPNVDKPRVDVQVLAESRTVAHALAQVVQAVIFQAMGQAFPAHGIYISDIRIETGITRVPDRETGAPRYIMAFRMVCVPA